MARRASALALALVPLLAAPVCAPEVQIVEEEIEISNLTTPGEVIEAGDEIGIRIPLENTGSADADAVGVLAQLLDRNGLVVEQRSFTLQRLDMDDEPILDFRPFATDAPSLIDGWGEVTFRISITVGPSGPTVHDHSFALLPALTPDLSVLEMWRERFVPFDVYPLNACFSVWTGTAGLLAALELYAIDPSLPGAISPAEAEAYVEHQALSLLAQYYDPDPSFVPCTAYPDSSTGLAALAYILKVHGTDWGRDVREAIRRAIHLPDWPYSGGDNVYNKTIPFPAMHLLFGEASCHAPSWLLGWQELSGMFLNHLQKGGFEANDRHYTSFHLANLGMLGFVDTAVVRQKARHLFDLKSLLSAHLYLPGGHIGVLNTRLGWDSPFFFPGEKRERSMGPMLTALAVGDDFVFADTPHSPHAVTLLGTVLALRQPLAPAIRHLFLAKGDGYEGWWLQRSSKSYSRFPGTINNLGEDGLPAYAWQFAVLPGGAASIGSSYGAWTESTGNKEGVAVRCPGCEQGFAFAYQWQACALGDTDDTGDVFCESAVPDPSESGYDMERMQVHRSRITLFDPRTRTSRWPATPTLPVVRLYELTRTYLTNWDHPVVGGEKIFPTPGGWYVGRIGDVFIAYRPLGDTVQTTQIDGLRLDGGTNVDYATLFEMQGRSGGLTVLADRDEIEGDTLADFAAEMDARFWSFTAAGPNDGPVAEMDYRAADGRLCRMKLEYMGTGGLPGKERRYIDCSAVPGTAYEEQSEAEFFAPLIGGQLMTSPYVSFDPATDVLRVDVPSLPVLEYDWGALRTAPQPLPDGCEERAYLELAEPAELGLEVVWPTDVPAFDVTIENTGFAPATVAASFEGDDCTGNIQAPNSAWIESPAEVVVPAGGSAAIHFTGATMPCWSGTYGGELVFSALAGNALDARLRVRLTVLP